MPRTPDAPEVEPDEPDTTPRPEDGPQDDAPLYEVDQ